MPENGYTWIKEVCNDQKENIMGTFAKMNVGVLFSFSLGNWNKHFQFFMYFIGIHTKMVRRSVVPYIP